MARKKRSSKHVHEEHTDESWLIPYSDLLTLLLALFIVLFSMRSEDKAKMQAMVESLYNAFNTVSVFETNSGGQTPSNTSFTSNQAQQKPMPNEDKLPEPTPKTGLNAQSKGTDENEKRLQELMKKLQTYINEKHLNANISLTDIGDGIQITLKDKIVFDSGSDKLKRYCFPILNNIASLVQSVDNPIIIEGHTDNHPIHSSLFKSNWELSGARALSVLHYFQDKGISPNRLRYIGYGEFKPLFKNDTPAHREENRRVNITILRK